MRDIQKFIDGLHDYIGKALRPLSDQVRGLVERVDALASREPEKGEKGEPGDSIKGEPGEPGRDGRDAPSEDEIRRFVAEAVAAIPPPKDGADGKDGVDGRSFTIEDVRDMLEGAMAKWALEFERRAQDTLQRAIDKMPAPADGKDGRDGSDGADALGFDDLTIEHDGRRSFALVAQRDGREIRKEVTLPVVLDAGFWKPGESAVAGDGFTFGGSYWIAQKATDTQPEVGNPDWRLAVRKGRDARMVQTDASKAAPKPVNLKGDDQ